jgi:hypothetical protein
LKAARRKVFDARHGTGTRTGRDSHPTTVVQLLH